MQPSRSQHGKLSALVIRMPEHPHDAGIAWLSAIRFEREPRRDSMGDQQSWNSEPEHDPEPAALASAYPEALGELEEEAIRTRSPYPD